MSERDTNQLFQPGFAPVLYRVWHLSCGRPNTLYAGVRSEERAVELQQITEYVEGEVSWITVDPIIGFECEQEA